MRIGLTGVGPVGLLAVQMARASGATSITAVDVNPARLEIARSCGATDVLDVSASGSRAADEPGRHDVLIECSGSTAATLAGLRALDPAGRAVLVGMGADEIPLPVPLIQARELVVTGTFRYTNTWPTAIALVASGRVDLDGLVSTRFGLDDVPAALLAGRADPTVVKAVVGVVSQR